MDTRIIIAFVLLSLVIGCQNKKSIVVVESDEGPSLIQDLVEIMEMWPGSYSNEDQVQEVIAAGGDIWREDDSGEGGYVHLTSHYISLDRPDIAEHTLYVEEYRDNDPSITYRQRIYTLAIDSANTHIRVKMWPFKDKKKYIGAYDNIAMLDSLGLDEISSFPDICDLVVDKKDGAYHMYMNQSDCTFGTRTFNYEVMLKDGLFSYRDKITDSETDSVTSAANFAYHLLDEISR